MIIVTLVGIVTLVISEHVWKAYSPILVNVLGITTTTGDDGQPKNDPYDVTDDGITVLLTLSSVPVKAPLQILVTLVGIVILDSDEQPENPPQSIEVILVGIITLVRFKQFIIAP